MNAAHSNRIPALLPRIIFPLGAVLLSCLCACGPAGGESPEATPNASGIASVSDPGTPPERIISLVPSLTEAVYALGAEDRLVGVSQYCKFPPEAQSKPQVGALISVNYEKVLLLDPDLVLLRPDQAEVERKLDALGIRSVRIATDSLDDVFSSIAKLGDVLDRSERAEALNRKIREELEAVRARASQGALGEKRPRVLLVVGRNPGTLQQIYAAGAGSFLVELMEIAGLENVLADSPIPWPVVSKESILKMDPDVILDGSLRGGEMPDGPGPHMAAWDELSTLSAVKNGRIVPFGDEHAAIPGPSVARSARLIRSLIEGAYGSAPEKASAAEAAPNES